MLYKILGMAWIAIGLLWLIQPQRLRGRLQRKMTLRMKWIVFGFLLTFGFAMLGSVLRADGLGIKIAGIIGMAITVKAILLITSKTSQKVISWWVAKPLIFFRIWGLLVLLAGLGLIFFEV